MKALEFIWEISGQTAMTNTIQDSKAILRAVNVTLTYRDGQNVIYAVREVNMAVATGEFVGILGPSGSGKTSLLYVLSGIRPASAGQVYFNGQDIDADVVSREKLRRRNFGFVFQQYFLINYLNVLQNIVVGAPTANLDPSTGAKVMEVLTSMRVRSSLIVVSHDEEILGQAETLYRMRDGGLERVG